MEQHPNTPNAQQVTRYIEFSLAGELYGFELLKVREVIPLPPTTRLPNAPAYYRGIMNLRGQIVSIIELSDKLGIPKAAKTSGARVDVIILDVQGLQVGIVVDSVNRILSVKGEDVSEVPQMASRMNAKYIEGVYRGKERLTMLLDIDGALGIDEIKQLQRKAG